MLNWPEIYALFDGRTPLLTDCGALCGHACCQGGPHDGMPLFPGEKARFAGADWCRVFTQGDMDILVCEGACPRDMRPLFCRLFPAMVYTNGTRMRLRLNPLARGVCPLAQEHLRALDPAFLEACRLAAARVCADEAGRAFIARYSRLVDEAFDCALFRA
nr:hypothetical protein [Maliibacterium massiliense]